jgi:hypothetical protein
MDLSWIPVAHACNSGYTGGWRLGGLWLEASPTNSLWDTISKITREKRAGGMTQVANCMPFKFEFLSSNPAQPKEKKCDVNYKFVVWGKTLQQL